MVVFNLFYRFSRFIKISRYSHKKKIYHNATILLFHVNIHGSYPLLRFSCSSKSLVKHRYQLYNKNMVPKMYPCLTPAYKIQTNSGTEKYRIFVKYRKDTASLQHKINSQSKDISSATEFVETSTVSNYFVKSISDFNNITQTSCMTKIVHCYIIFWHIFIYNILMHLVKKLLSL